MNTEVSCTTCGRKLSLPDVEPGQVVRCPYCQMKVEVPPAPAVPPADAGTGRWYVHSFEGQRYGPISKEELDQWVREERLTADCQVFQEGWPQWRWAADVYPSLRAASDLSLKKPISTAPPAAPRGGPGAEPHPYASPQAPGGPVPAVPGQWFVPHRGALILTLGLLSFLLTCVLLGLPAWIMGMNDIKEMRAGRMDPSGEGLTIAGMVLGIIATIITALLVLFVCAGVMIAG
jgi:DNA-directed RNA polymerase subunit RPC12/RpoP